MQSMQEIPSTHSIPLVMRSFFSWNQCRRVPSTRSSPLVIFMYGGFSPWNQRRRYIPNTQQETYSNNGRATTQSPPALYGVLGCILFIPRIRGPRDFSWNQLINAVDRHQAHGIKQREGGDRRGYPHVRRDVFSWDQ